MKKGIFIAMMAVCSIQIQAQFSGKGSGTEKDPYQVTNADELFEVRNDLSAYYKQMNDIDLTEWIEEESPQQGWKPISSFLGIFDGGNHVISGLTINRPNESGIGLFGSVEGGEIKNCIIKSPVLVGNTNVGSIAGYSKIPITNCTIIHPNLHGISCVGGVAGRILTNLDTSFINCSVFGGNISSESYAGGIIGRTEYSDIFETSSTSYIISCNYSSTSVNSKSNAGGIIGYAESYLRRYTNYANRTTIMENNISEANIVSDLECGGIVQLADMKLTKMNNNIFYGTIKGGGDVHGIGRFYELSTDNRSNFCNSDSLVSTGNIYRIGNRSSEENYAYNGMVLLQNGKQVVIEDGVNQGIGYGLRTLRKESTYVGAGFDFSNTWTIKEGETFPYLKAQVAPVTVTSFASGSKATIKGTATEGTTVYVMIGDNMYESYILDGQWEVSLGSINAGTVAKVYAMTRGRMPSISTKAIAESGSEPILVDKVGDANSDGVIDTADVTAIINYILGKPSASFNKTNADVTGDGEILIDDAVQTVQLIMNAQ